MFWSIREEFYQIYYLYHITLICCLYLLYIILNEKYFVATTLFSLSFVAIKWESLR